MREPERPLLTVHVERLVVELGWCPQVPKLDAVRVVAALDVLGACVDVRKVGADPDGVGDAVRTLEANRRT